MRHVETMILYVTCHPDREPVVPATGSVRVWDTYHQGQLPNYITALKRGLFDRTPTITILEDDVEVPPGFVPYVDHFLSFIAKYNHVVQWWCNGRMWTPSDVLDNDTGTPYPIFVHRKASKFLSLQAVTYARPIAEKILVYLERVNAIANPDDLGQKHSGDMHIGRLLHMEGHDFLIHWPPIVKHVGAQSMVAPGMSLDDGFRTNPYYSWNNAIDVMKRRPSPIVLYPGEYDET